MALIYDALLALQHRGQDAAGIVTEDTGRLCLRKDMGMVSFLLWLELSTLVVLRLAPALLPRAVRQAHP